MTKVFLAMFISFGVTVALGPMVISFLKRVKFGQNILDIGPYWHKSKQGTPTMGGLMFISGIVLAVAIFGMEDLLDLEFRPLAVVIFSLIFGLIGFVDDFIMVVKKRNLGLTALQKIILQFLTASAFLAFLITNNYLSTKVFFPFINQTIDFAWFFYVFAIITIVGVVNSVNLTDGVDGLAASVTIPIVATLSILAVSFGAMGLAIVSMAIVGGLLGFLVYNFYPAKIIMGDTGSLFLGGAVCGLAFALNIPLIIFIAGLIYIIEALSVIIQVTYFKISGGKRLFKMSPIHHHFELSGWKEVKIVYVFTAITAILCLVAFFGFSYLGNI